MTHYATRGCYILLGASAAIIAACKAIEAGNDWLAGHEIRRRQLFRWANYWMQTPRERAKGQQGECRCPSPRRHAIHVCPDKR